MDRSELKHKQMRTFLSCHRVPSGSKYPNYMPVWKTLRQPIGFRSWSKTFQLDHFSWHLNNAYGWARIPARPRKPSPPSTSLEWGAQEDNSGGRLVGQLARGRRRGYAPANFTLWAKLICAHVYCMPLHADWNCEEQDKRTGPTLCNVLNVLTTSYCTFSTRDFINSPLFYHSCCFPASS